jgi:hypothetical protein
MTIVMGVCFFRYGFSLVAVVWICVIATSAVAGGGRDQEATSVSPSEFSPRWATDVFESPSLERGLWDDPAITTPSREFLLSSNLAWAAAAQAGTTQLAAGSTKENTEAEDMAAIGEAMANPLSYLWMMSMQNDTIWNEGNALDSLNKDGKPQNIFLLNPVLSIQLSEDWKAIFRPVFPIVSFNTLDNVNIPTGNPGDVLGVGRSRESGLGDIVLWTAFSNMYKPPFIFGFGPTLMFDTATDEQLGSGKNSAGPMALAAYVTDKWIIATIAQHWQSFSGESNIDVDTNLGKVSVDRPGVSLTDVQPIIRYRLSPLTNVGFAPNVR